MCTKP